MVTGLNVLKNPSETDSLLTRVFQVFLTVPRGPRAVPVLWQTPLAACRGRRHYLPPVAKKPGRCLFSGKRLSLVVGVDANWHVSNVVRGRSI